MKKWQRADAQKEEIGIAMGNCIKSYLERVGEEWKKTTERRNWRLLTENVLTINEMKKIEKEFMHGLICFIMKGIHIQNNYNNNMQFDPSLDLTRLPPRESTLDGKWTRKPFGLSRVQHIYQIFFFRFYLNVPRPS